MINNHKTIDWEFVEEKLYNYRKDWNAVQKSIPLMRKIVNLCEQEGATLLAHYYQIPELQYIAHSAGDSLKLCLDAQKVETPYILFCGVHFMAESAHLLNPDKKVLLPDLEASCSIAEGITPDMIKHIRRLFPEAAILAYINTTAETKAEVDSIFTSSNAEKILNNIPNKQIILLPDPNLSANLFEKMKDKISGKEVLYYKEYDFNKKILLLRNASRNFEVMLPSFIGQEPKTKTGACYVHEELSQSPQMIEGYRQRYNPDLIVGHFEISPQIIQDGYLSLEKTGSTTDMINMIKKSNAKKVLMLTECNHGAAIMNECPKVEIITPCILCKYMKKISLEKVIHSLETKQNLITIQEPIFSKARKSIEKMFELTGSL